MAAHGRSHLVLVGVEVTNVAALRHPLTRADIEGRKMENAMHVDFSRSESAWIGTCEGLPRLGVGKYRLKTGSVTRWSIDGKEVRDLDAALAVLNGEMTLEEAMVVVAPPAQRPKKSLIAQIAEVDYELKQRDDVYKRIIANNPSRRGELELHVETLKAVRATLVWLQDNEAHIKQRASY